MDLIWPGMAWCCKLVELNSSLFNEDTLAVKEDKFVITGVVIPHSIKIFSGSIVDMSDGFELALLVDALASSDDCAA